MFFTRTPMDLTTAIDRHRDALARLVGLMFAMIGLDEGRAVERLSRRMNRAVLRLLAPAESAVRRLIAVAAHGIEVKPPQPRPSTFGLNIARSSRGRVSFRLFDPPQRFAELSFRHFGRATGGPRIRVIDTEFDPRIPLFRAEVPAPREPTPDDGTIDAAPLCRRLAAITAALEDLPRQARRYARWLARPVEKRRPQRVSLLRSGPPPGFRKRPIYEVDHILIACDRLARELPGPDSS
jgi:hypothetical protein